VALGPSLTKPPIPQRGRKPKVYVYSVSHAKRESPITITASLVSEF
jgi:hypothetical protein